MDQAAYAQSGMDPASAQYANALLPPAPYDPQMSSSDPAAPVNGAKRKDAPLPAGNSASKKRKRRNFVGVRDDTQPKPKRVRTGCLTCRERHLKCDEGTPQCKNCMKGDRECKWGLKLNFLDTICVQPPTDTSLFGSPEWLVAFEDESREIASEYAGGAQMYKAVEPDISSRPSIQMESSLAFDVPATVPPAPNMPQQQLPPIQGTFADPYPEPTQQQDPESAYDPQLRSVSYPQQIPHSTATNHSHFSNSSQSTLAPGSVGSYNHAQVEGLLNQEEGTKEFLDGKDETLYMQVFVEEVGAWMDTMDRQKHFSRLLPFHALADPMLLNAFLACGARHLVLINPNFSEEKALDYYDTATRYLLKSLQDANRDTVVCATTAVILNIYEIMSERPLQRMNHIAGARALIKECGWNARTEGIGSACFWLNVGMEVLSCLRFNWSCAWDPDEWGLDMDLSRELENGREEVWTHRMLYIVGKISNFRATIPQEVLADPRDEQMRSQQRFEQYSHLRSLADQWIHGIPRTMHPMAFVPAGRTNGKSLFPEVWMIERSTTVGRLFYHTGMLLLSQIHPYSTPAENAALAEEELHHAHVICGIAAHVKDRGVSSTLLRSLAHAGEVLTDRGEQEEVVSVLQQIRRETGWRIDFMFNELKTKWGWTEESTPQQLEAQKQEQQAQQQQQQQQQQEQHQHEQHQQKLLQDQARAAQQHTLQSLHAPPRAYSASYTPPRTHFDPTASTGYPQLAQQRPLSLQQPSHQPQLPPSSTSLTQAPTTTASSAAKSKKRVIPKGIPNPMYAKADFTLPQHPYQNFYVAPVMGTSRGGTPLGVPGTASAANVAGRMGGMAHGGLGGGGGMGGGGGFYYGEGA